MKKKLIVSLISHLIEALPNDIIKIGLDKMLDAIEDRAKKSENKVDDAIVLPLCAWVRESLDIPDND